MSNVTIISDGTAKGTKVQVGDTFIKEVTKIEILPIEPEETVKAVITVDMVSLRASVKDADIVCTDVLAESKIREALLEFSEHK